MIQDHCLLRASSLAFSSLLALVPLTAFIFSLFTGFGAFQDVKSRFRDILVRFLVPTRQDEILDYIDLFIENSRAMGVVGLLLFAVTSIFLLNGISENINAVWGSSPRIGFLRKFSLYISLIVLGTLLIGVGFSLSSSLKHYIYGSKEFSAIIKFFVFVGPSTIIFIILWLIVYTIPSAKVRLDSSLIAAVSGTVLWELARFGFVDGTNYVLRMSVLYGSLASIPIFLIWLSIQWLVILIAVEIAYIHQHPAYRYLENERGAIVPYFRIRIGLSIYLSVVKRFLHGEKPHSLRSLARKHELSPNDVECYLKRFCDSGLLTYTHGSPSVVLPTKEPAVTTFREVFEALFGYPVSDEDTAADHVNAFFENGTASFRKRTVLEMAAQHENQHENQYENQYENQHEKPAVNREENEH